MKTAEWIALHCRFAAKPKTKGFVERETLKGGIPKFLEFKGTHRSNYDGKGRTWTKIGSTSGLDETAEKLQEIMRYGSYALLWNDSEYVVVFRDRTFKAARPPSKDELKDAIIYGKKVGVAERFFLGIQKDVRAF